MFYLLFTLAVLATAKGFTLQLNAQSYCVSSDLQYCFGLIEPCTGTLVKVPQPRNLTVFMCVFLTGVQTKEVGTQHVFTLNDPFGRFVCSHKTVNGSFNLGGWGSRQVTLSILGYGFGQNKLTVPEVCSNGVVLKVPSVSNVVYACMSLKHWTWEYFFWSYTIKPVASCDLRVKSLTTASKHYYPNQEGVFARPIKDEL
ncbi:hypothetical protein [Bat coronavirus HKU9-4]|uniref:Uncharacterized protein NS7a n=1 Tax=Bat coronavirus HKU9-4 TaxID=424370 RepID=A3EXJ5_BCHK9|nr:hypothetical protein [Bat coronavirus HKU9-4]